MITSKSLNGKNIFVFGLGKAGISTVRALSESKANIFAWDDNEDSRKTLVDMLEKESRGNVILKKIEDVEFDDLAIDFLILSPGIALTHPKPHLVVQKAKRANCPIICDIELLYMADSNAKFIGITGTNGKSTTTALIGHIFKELELKSAVGGNIGIPVLDLDALGGGGTYIIETSSYQLDLIKDTKFDISILLNITPDHLDRHGGLDGYIAVKKTIFDRLNNNRNSAAIIGVDDDYCRDIYEQLKQELESDINKGEKKIIPISVKEKLKDGISIIDGVIYDGGKEQVQIGHLQYLAGEHNAQNIAVAYAVAKLNNIADEDIINSIKSFKGLAHRMQYLGERARITFVNDSKATNAEAAAKALASFEKDIYWIAGGVAKDGGIEQLSEFFPKIKKAYLIGGAASEFAKTLEGKTSYEKCEDLDRAFDKAVIDAQNDLKGKNSSNPVILLSPACASFDQWKNFEARGDFFIDKFVGL